MRAIILAAGIGSRLRPITNYKPKTLVEVNNKPMLGYLIDALIKNKIIDIVISVGFQHTHIVNYCKTNYPNINFKFINNIDFDTTNNMYSLYLARKYLTGDILLMNADLVIDDSIIKELIMQTGSRVAVKKNIYMEESMKIVVNDENKIVEISKQISEDRAYGTSIDIYKLISNDSEILNRELVKIIEEEQNLNEWTEVLLNKLFKNKIINAEPYDINNKRWYEIDNYEDLNNAEILFNNNIDILRDKKIFFIDIDGTLMLGNKLIDGSEQFIKKLKSQNKKIYIITNNSSKTPQGHLKKLTQCGMKEICLENILVSTDSAISYINENNIKNVYWAANEEVSQYLSDKGIVYDEIQPQAVLLTYDTEINYNKLRKIVTFINQGIPYLATHEDVVCPTEDYNIPDIGTFIKLIETTTGILPNKVFGKPNKSFIKHILDKHMADYRDAVIIGDRLYTDIKLAEDSDLTSILVLSGETKREHYEESDLRSDILVSSINKLIQYLN